MKILLSLLILIVMLYSVSVRACEGSEYRAFDFWLGEYPNQQGQIEQHKISWTPNTNGTGRQHWQVIKYGTNNWVTLFDGTYHKISQ